MRDLFGFEPATPVEGCLQDIHWALGLLGYFPSYAYGAVAAANMLQGMRKSRLLDCEGGWRVQDFRQVHTWMVEHVAGRGCEWTQPEMSQMLGLEDTRQYMSYLADKYERR